GFAPQTLQVTVDGKSSSIDLKRTDLTSATATFSGKMQDRGPASAPFASPIMLVPSAGLVLQGDNGTFKVLSESNTGNFTFTGVPPGDYVLTATSFRYFTNYAKVSLHAGDNGNTFTMSLTQDPSGGVPAKSQI